MELTELVISEGKLVGPSGKPVNAKPVREPVFVRLETGEYNSLSISERVRKQAQMLAFIPPAEANAYCVGIDGIETKIRKKIGSTPYGKFDFVEGQRADPIFEDREAIAYPVQFYTIKSRSKKNSGE